MRVGQGQHTRMEQDSDLLRQLCCIKSVICGFGPLFIKEKSDKKKYSLCSEMSVRFDVFSWIMGLDWDN